ncbi:MAG TPA: hypothetical protein VIM64_10800 [Puia sp.]
MQIRHLVMASFILTAALAAISCHKDPMPPPNRPSDIAAVRLKDINEPHLPSPFYHFEYNDSGYITNASFSSGLGIYDLVYSNKRLFQMKMNILPNKDILQYSYLNDDVVTINITDKNGINYRRAYLTYTPSHQLKQLDWVLKIADGGFVPEQTLLLSYYSDGNLKELTTHYHAVGSQTEALFTDRFENYDDKINVDAFTLLHSDQNHHLYLLPGIKIQLNNARRNIRTGDGVNYDVSYTYTYDTKGRPAFRSGDLLWLSGSDSGKHFQVSTTFSYYD